MCKLIHKGGKMSTFYKTRVPTVIENPEKKWSWKVMENSKNSEFHGNLFARKKVMEKSVVQIHLIVFLLCCDQCGSTLYSSVSLITTIVLHLCYTYT